MDADRIDNKLDDRSNARLNAQERIIQSQESLNSVDDKIADFKLRQERRLNSDDRITDQVASNLIQPPQSELPLLPKVLNSIQINGQRLLVDNAHWNGGVLCLYAKENSLQQLQKIWAVPDLEIVIVGIADRFTISMLLSSGYIEIRKTT